MPMAWQSGYFHPPQYGSSGYAPMRHSMRHSMKQTLQYGMHSQQYHGMINRYPQNWSGNISCSTLPSLESQKYTGFPVADSQPVNSVPCSAVENPADFPFETPQPINYVPCSAVGNPAGFPVANSQPVNCSAVENPAGFPFETPQPINYVPCSAVGNPAGFPVANSQPVNSMPCSAVKNPPGFPFETPQPINYVPCSAVGNPGGFSVPSSQQGCPMPRSGQFQVPSPYQNGGQRPGFHGPPMPNAYQHGEAMYRFQVNQESMQSRAQLGHGYNLRQPYPYPLPAAQSNGASTNVSQLERDKLHGSGYCFSATNTFPAKLPTYTQGCYQLHHSGTSARQSSDSAPVQPSVRVRIQSVCNPASAGGALLSKDTADVDRHHGLARSVGCSNFPENQPVVSTRCKSVVVSTRCKSVTSRLCDKTDQRAKTASKKSKQLNKRDLLSSKPVKDVHSSNPVETLQTRIDHLIDNDRALFTALTNITGCLDLSTTSVQNVCKCARNPVSCDLHNPLRPPALQNGNEHVLTSCNPQNHAPPVVQNFASPVVQNFASPVVQNDLSANAEDNVYVRNMLNRDVDIMTRIYRIGAEGEMNSRAGKQRADTTHSQPSGPDGPSSHRESAVERSVIRDVNSQPPACLKRSLSDELSAFRHCEREAVSPATKIKSEPDTEELENEEPDIFDSTCIACSKVFSKRDELSNHLSVHKKPSAHGKEKDVFDQNAAGTEQQSPLNLALEPRGSHLLCATSLGSEEKLLAHEQEQAVCEERRKSTLSEMSSLDQFVCSSHDVNDTNVSTCSQDQRKSLQTPVMGQGYTLTVEADLDSRADDSLLKVDQLTRSSKEVLGRCNISNCSTDMEHDLNSSPQTVQQSKQDSFNLGCFDSKTQPMNSGGHKGDGGEIPTACETSLASDLQNSTSLCVHYGDTSEQKPPKSVAKEITSVDGRIPVDTKTAHSQQHKELRGCVKRTEVSEKRGQKSVETDNTLVSIKEKYDLPAHSNQKRKRLDSVTNSSHEKEQASTEDSLLVNASVSKSDVFQKIVTLKHSPDNSVKERGVGEFPAEEQKSVRTERVRHKSSHKEGENMPVSHGGKKSERSHGHLDGVPCSAFHRKHSKAAAAFHGKRTTSTSQSFQHDEQTSGAEVCLRDTGVKDSVNESPVQVTKRPDGQTMADMAGGINHLKKWKDKRGCVTSALVKRTDNLKRAASCVSSPKKTPCSSQLNLSGDGWSSSKMESTDMSGKTLRTESAQSVSPHCTKVTTGGQLTANTLKAQRFISSLNKMLNNKHFLPIKKACSEEKQNFREKDVSVTNSAFALKSKRQCDSCEKVTKNDCSESEVRTKVCTAQKIEDCGSNLALQKENVTESRNMCSTKATDFEESGCQNSLSDGVSWTEEFMLKNVKKHRTDCGDQSFDGKKRTGCSGHSSEVQKRKTDIGDKSSEGINHITDSSDKSSEGINHRTDSSDKSSEGINHRTDSSNKSEGINHRTDSSDKSTEGMKHRTDSGDKSSEGMKHRTDSSDKSSEGMKHRTDSSDKSSEGMKHRTDSGDKSSNGKKERTICGDQSSEGKKHGEYCSKASDGKKHRKDSSNKSLEGKKHCGDQSSKEKKHKTHSSDQSSKDNKRREGCGEKSSEGKQRTEQHGQSSEGRKRGTDHDEQSSEGKKRRTDCGDQHPKKSLFGDGDSNRGVDHSHQFSFCVKCNTVFVKRSAYGNHGCCQLGREASAKEEETLGENRALDRGVESGKGGVEKSDLPSLKTVKKRKTSRIANKEMKQAKWTSCRDGGEKNRSASCVQTMFTCDHCQQTYSSRGGLLFHWKTVHKKP